MRTPSKILSRDALLHLRHEAREAGRTVVHCHGCFDIVHPGHIKHLQFAKSLGEVLVVSVSADSQVNKGVNRPLIPDDLRASSLAALECVDWVYVNEQPTAVALLEALQPDVYVKGREYERSADVRFLAEREAASRYGGRVVFSSGEIVYSSTALINGLEETDQFHDEKLARLRQRYALSDSHLYNLLRHAEAMRIVVVGDYILDRYHFCDATGIAGEGPLMSLRTLQTRDFDGGAGAIAGHLARQGARPTLVCALADDADSQRASMRFAAEGIDVLAPMHRRRTATETRYLVDQQKLFKVDDASPAPSDSQQESELTDKILQAADGAAAVVFADFGYGVITAGLIDRVLPALRSNVPILAASGSGRQSNLLRFQGVDLLCPTEREVREAQHDFSAGLGAVVWNLLNATGVGRAIVTLGKQGVVTFDQDEHSHDGRLRSEYIPALAQPAIDSLGCNEALFSTATLALAAGGSLQAAAYLGSIASAVELQMLGNRPVTLDAILRHLGRSKDIAAAA